MLLAIDVGNTQTHVGAFDGSELVEHWRFSTDREATGDEIAITIHDLLGLRGIEFELGRRPGPRHGPRPIDVDLLLVGDATLADERLVLPHRDLTRRRFVLVPLLELEPELALPDGTRLEIGRASCRERV